MFGNLARLFTAGVMFTAAEARRIHNTLIGIIVAAFAVIVLMWIINISGGKAFNIVLFLAGGLYIAVSFTRPLVAATAASAGVVVAGLADKDLSQGALTGLKALYKVTIGALFGFWILAGLLSTWSYQESPAAFWYIMAMVLTISVTAEVFAIKNDKIAARLIIGYAMIVILVSFWQTVGSGDRQKLQGLLPTQVGASKTAPLIGAGEQVRFDLTGQTMKDEHDVGVFDTLVVTSRRHPRADGKTIYLPCGKIVAPRLVASANGLPATQFKNTSLPGRFENHLVLTEETKRFLVENQVARVRVTFEAVETTALEAREACHATAW